MFANSIAADPSGDFIIGGELRGTANFGGGLQTVAPEDGGPNIGAFVAKYDADGNYLWSHVFNGSEGANASIVRADGAGNVFLFGMFWGEIDFGGGNLTSPSNQQANFVAKLDSSGNFVWANAYGNQAAASYDLFSARVDSSGNAVFAGELAGSLDFGGGALTGSGATNMYLVKLDSMGSYVWGETFPCTGNDVEPSDLSIDSSGNIVVGGYFEESVNLGGSSLTSSEGSNNYNSFVAKYTSTGAYVWSQVFQDALQVLLTGVGTDPSGDVFVTGTFAGNRCTTTRSSGLAWTSANSRA